MSAADMLETIEECGRPGGSSAAGWEELRRYLLGRHGSDVVDRAVYGSLPVWEADELLADFVRPDFLELADEERRPARRQLGRLVDELLTTGAA